MSASDYALTGLTRVLLGSNQLGDEFAVKLAAVLRGVHVVEGARRRLEPIQPAVGARLATHRQRHRRHRALLRGGSGGGGCGMRAHN